MRHSSRIDRFEILTGFVSIQAANHVVGARFLHAILHRFKIAAAFICDRWKGVTPGTAA
jgi:hypothetical protein